MGQVGSHFVMIKPNERANISIPQHKELSVGTLRVLIRNSGLTVEQFLYLLRRSLKTIIFKKKNCPCGNAGAVFCWAFGGVV